MESFGGHGEVVQATEEFAPAFRRAAESGRPALIELRMNPEQITSRATITQFRAGTGVVKPERTLERYTGTVASMRPSRSSSTVRV